MNTQNETQKLRERAQRVMSGPQTNLRTPAGVDLPFFVRGKGNHIWDADGKELIDYTTSAGPGVFGHSNPEYIEALKNQLDTLYHTYTSESRTVLEVELAEKIVEHVPCAESVRFSVAGTEAVQLSLRLGRAYTGRPYFIRFEGHYHGWLDNVLGGAVDDNPTESPFPRDIDSKENHLYTQGRDPAAYDNSFLLPWNNIDILEQVLAKHGRKVALIMMEPIMCNGGCCPPRPGYLQRVRELCNQYGIVLCFDEIITGFRVGLGGAQGELGITPDLATFGKAMAGGIPLSAVAGKRDIMDLLLDMKVFGGGTFNGYPLGMAAGLAAITILEKDSGAHYKRIKELQNRLMTGIKEIGLRRGFPILLQSINGLFQWLFDERDIAYDVKEVAEADTKLYHKFKQIMFDEGVLLLWSGRWWLSSGLTDTDAQKTLECVDRAIGRL